LVGLRSIHGRCAIATVGVDAHREREA
jgi:hypothetical protein